MWANCHSFGQKQLEPPAGRRFLICFRRSSRNSPDLLETQVGLKLIAWLEIQHGHVGLAHKEVAVALHRGDVAQAAATPAAFAVASTVSKAVALGFQEGLIVRWVAFIGQIRPLTSLTPGGKNRVWSQCRPHGEFCLPVRCAVLHGHTSRRSGPD